MNTDLLVASLNYAIEQAELSDISIMDFSEEEHLAEDSVSLDEQIQKLKKMRDALKTSTTAKLLLLIADCTLDNDPMQNVAPNFIQELTYELLLKENVDERQAGNISDAVFVLTSNLVADAGLYK